MCSMVHVLVRLLLGGWQATWQYYLLGGQLEAGLGGYLGEWLATWVGS